MSHESPTTFNQQEQYSWDNPPLNAISLAKGEHSVAYSFDTDEGPRVLRVGEDSDYGYRKDAYAADHFAAPNLPIPKVDYVCGPDTAGSYSAVS